MLEPKREREDDDVEREDGKRRSRNLSEKKRRDQFNVLINELASMVSTTGRKLDKSSVLRSTIAFLRNHNEQSTSSQTCENEENWKPSFLSNEEFTHLMLEALDGFIMVISCSGKILYTSEGIISLLGHLPSDMLNMTIYDLLPDEEKSNVYNVLSGGYASSPTYTGCDTTKEQIEFRCHLRSENLNKEENKTYENVKFWGYFRPWSVQPSTPQDVGSDLESLDASNSLPGQSSKLEPFGTTTESRVFIGTGRLIRPKVIRIISLLDTSASEFISRHSLEWKYLFLDHRAPPIIGYLPFEVLGTSGYDYYHADDLEKVAAGHEQLISRGEGTSCYYRFLTKGQQWIWLQTKYYITYHQWNSKPEFIVCTHRVVSYADVRTGFKEKKLQESNYHSKQKAVSSTSETQLGIGVHSNIMPQRTTATNGASRATYYMPHRNKIMPYTHAGQHQMVTARRTEGTCQETKSQSSTFSNISLGGASDRPPQEHGSEAGSPLHFPTSQQHEQQQQHPHQQQQHQQQPVPSPHAQMIKSEASSLTFPGEVTSTAAENVYGASPGVNHASLTVPGLVDVNPSSPMEPQMRLQAPLVLTPMQSQLQEQLRKKHSDLQQAIAMQQKELRSIQEHLYLMQCGAIPPSVLKVTLPYNNEEGGMSHEATSGNPTGYMMTVSNPHEDTNTSQAEYLNNLPCQQSFPENRGIYLDPAPVNIHHLQPSLQTAPYPFPQHQAASILFEMNPQQLGPVASSSHASMHGQQPGD